MPRTGKPKRVDPAVAVHRSRVGVLTRFNAPEAEIAAARADLASAKIDEIIAGLIAQAPVLTADQRARLATLLNDEPAQAAS